MGFHELVLAVVDALVGGGVLAIRALGDGHFAEISGVVFLSLVILVELELRQVILSRGAVIAEGLGDVQLVGEHDDLIRRGFAGFAFAANIRVVRELKGGLVRIALGTNLSVLIQRGSVFDGELVTSNNGDFLVISVLDGLCISNGEVEGVIIGSRRVESVGVSAKLLAFILDNHGVTIEGQTCGLSIVEDQLVGLVCGEISRIGRQGGGQLERNIVIHVVVGGILPVSCGTVSRVVDVLDLLFKGRLVSLTVHSHRTIDPHDEQGRSIVTSHGGAVLQQVVTCGSIKRGVLGDRAESSTVQINELGNGCQLRSVISSATKLSNLDGSFGGSQISASLASTIIRIEVLASGDVTQSVVLAQRTGENLIHRVGVRIFGRHSNLVRVRCHCGACAEHAGDGHCCGCCHSDEAFENLIHCSPFLSFSINLLKSSLFSNVFNYFSVIELLPRRQWSFVLRTIPSSSRRVHCRRLLTFRASPAVATDAMATSNPVAKVFIFPSPPVPGNTTPG